MQISHISSIFQVRYIYLVFGFTAEANNNPQLGAHQPDRKTTSTLERQIEF